MVVCDIGGQNGNHSQDDLAKFGSRLDGKVEKFKNILIFWLPAGSSLFFFPLFSSFFFFFFFWCGDFTPTVTK